MSLASQLGASAANLTKVAYNPYAAPAPNLRKRQEKEKKKRPKPSMPWWAMPTALAGAGSYGMARGIASDAQVAAVRKAVSEYDPRAFTDPEFLPKGDTAHTYYQRTLSPGAQLRPFGVPAGDLLVALRTRPEIMKALGTESYALHDPKKTEAQNRAQREGVGGRAHYKSFSGGPIPAYAHQMKAKFTGNKVPTEFGVPEGTRYTDWMGRKFEDFVAKETGQRINPFEVHPGLISNDEQGALMRKFHVSLTPEEQAYRINVERSPHYAAQTGNYLPKAEQLVDIRDTFKGMASPLVGAGVGAGLGHLGYNLLTGEQDEDEEEGWGHELATLGGAGLGGLAGYMATPEMSQQALSNLYTGSGQAYDYAKKSLPGAYDYMQKSLPSIFGKKAAELHKQAVDFPGSIPAPPDVGGGESTATRTQQVLGGKPPATPGDLAPHVDKMYQHGVENPGTAYRFGRWAHSPRARYPVMQSAIAQGYKPELMPQAGIDVVRKMTPSGFPAGTRYGDTNTIDPARGTPISYSPVSSPSGGLPAAQTLSEMSGPPLFTGPSPAFEAKQLGLGGFPAIMRHEQEHSRQIPLQAGPDAVRQLDLPPTRRSASVLQSLPAWLRPQKHTWGGTKGEMERSIDRPMMREYALEFAPSLSDVIVLGEQAGQSMGKPLQHQVEFPTGGTRRRRAVSRKLYQPPGTKKDIQWMISMAKKHGLLSGDKTMTQLLAEPPGRAFMQQMFDKTKASDRQQDAVDEILRLRAGGKPKIPFQLAVDLANARHAAELNKRESAAIDWEIGKGNIVPTRGTGAPDPTPRNVHPNPARRRPAPEPKRSSGVWRDIIDAIMGKQAMLATRVTHATPVNAGKPKKERDLVSNTGKPTTQNPEQSGGINMVRIGSQTLGTKIAGDLWDNIYYGLGFGKQGPAFPPTGIWAPPPKKPLFGWALGRKPAPPAPAPPAPAPASQADSYYPTLANKLRDQKELEAHRKYELETGLRKPEVGDVDLAPINPAGQGPRMSDNAWDPQPVPNTAVDLGKQAATLKLAQGPAAMPKPSPPTTPAQPPTFAPPIQPSGLETFPEPGGTGVGKFVPTPAPTPAPPMPHRTSYPTSGTTYTRKQLGERGAYNAPAEFTETNLRGTFLDRGNVRPAAQRVVDTRRLQARSNSVLGMLTGSNVTIPRMRDEITHQLDTTRPITRTDESLGEAVKHYYANVPGGFEGAQDEAIAAQQAGDPTRGTYGQPVWTKADVAKKQPVYWMRGGGEVPSASVTGGGGAVGGFSQASPSGAGNIMVGTPAASLTSRGEYDPSQGTPGAESVLEHELTHSSLQGDPLGREPAEGFENVVPGAHFRARINALNRTPQVDPAVGSKATGMTEKYVKYLTSAAELDPRLAGIKREYAKHFGKLVNTPEEAKKALDWYMQRGAGVPHRPETSIRHDMDPEDLQGLIEKGDLDEEKLKSRMMELIQSQQRQGIEESPQKLAAALGKQAALKGIAMLTNATIPLKKKGKPVGVAKVKSTTMTMRRPVKMQGGKVVCAKPKKKQPHGETGSAHGYGKDASAFTRPGQGATGAVTHLPNSASTTATGSSSSNTDTPRNKAIAKQTESQTAFDPQANDSSYMWVPEATPEKPEPHPPARAIKSAVLQQLYENAGIAKKKQKDKDWDKVDEIQQQQSALKAAFLKNATLQWGAQRPTHFNPGLGQEMSTTPATTQMAKKKKKRVSCHQGGESAN